MSGSGFARALAILATTVAVAQGCGGESRSRSGSQTDETTGGESGTSSTGGVTMDGAAPSGGVEPTGGVNDSGVPGVGGSGTGAASGTSGRPVNTDPECAEIMRDMPCPVEGKDCRDLVCGLADTGRRQCVCATVWNCTSCDTARPRPPDVNIPLCPAEVVEGGVCTTDGTVCGPIGEEYCACVNDPADGLTWICETPPGPWP